MSIKVNEGGLPLKEAILKARELPKGEKEIIIEEGKYFFDEPILLSPEDSGLSIKGEGKAELFGGKKVTNWTKRDDRLWSAPVEGVKEGKWDFRMLIVNGRFASRARFPEQGFLLHETEFDVTWLSTYEGGFERDPSYEELTTLKFKPQDIPSTFVPENAEITCFHMWDESLAGVKSIDREKNIITFSNPTGWPPGAFAKAYSFERRYIVWNTEEGLHHPGQWYLDRKNGEVVYWPMPGEDMSAIDVVAPLVENLIIADGLKDNPIEGVQIENLSLEATNAPLMSGAFGAKLFDGALAFRNVNNCLLKDLSIQNVGAHCIKISGDDNKVESCNLNNAGAGAIRLVGSRGHIKDNYIHDIGKTFPSAIAMYVGATDPNVPDEWEAGLDYTDCIIEHNELHDVPYAAICAGGKKLKIHKNLIYRAMQDLYDGAGIYITFCDDAVVKHNFIRDIKDSPGAGTSAYYLDEKSIGCLIEENVEINVPRPSHNHISENNTFRNNFFIIDGAGYFSMERGGGYTFEKNVIVTGDGFNLYDLRQCDKFANNILFTGKGKLMTKELNKYEVLKEYEIDLKDGNVNTDPLFKNYKDGNIQFDANSPAHALGIKEINVSDAGLINKKRVKEFA